MQTILYYVQHLMGVGHVFRAMRIARSLVSEGVRVEFVFGGEPVPNFSIDGANIHYLPSLRAGSKVFRDMETSDGTVADDAYKQKRSAMLTEIFHKARPDAVVIETFPLGRRQMRFELLPLLEAIKGSQRKIPVFSSVRDILQENWKPERYEEAVRYADLYFDHFLVHGDPGFARLDMSFPPIEKIRGKLVYTGIVSPESGADPIEPIEDDVVVSVGGGLMGSALVLAAIKARKLSVLGEARWLIAHGINMDGETIRQLHEEADGQVRLVPFVDNLRGVMRQTKLSISRCGYNTVADLLESRTRAVVVPIHDGVETEQIRRAEILAAKGFAEVVLPQNFSIQALADAIDRAMAHPVPDRTGIDLDGAKKSARSILERM